jgi:hypothetical protein
MILPVRKANAAAPDAQRLLLIERNALGCSQTELDPVRFVPMETGKI